MIACPLVIRPAARATVVRAVSRSRFASLAASMVCWALSKRALRSPVKTEVLSGVQSRLVLEKAMRALLLLAGRRDGAGPMRHYRDDCGEIKTRRADFSPARPAAGFSPLPMVAVACPCSGALACPLQGTGYGLTQGQRP